MANKKNTSNYIHPMNKR